MRTFYTIIVTQIFSMIGSQISSLVIGIHLYRTTGSATPLALTAFFGLLPTLFASSIAGIVTDRFNRRLIMAVADMGQAAVTVCLFFSFASGQFQVWHLYLAALIQQTFAMFQMPAFNASITMMVPPDKRDQANGLAQGTGPLAGIISPVMAGVMYGLVGVPGAIAFDLFTFVIAFSVMLRMHIPQPEKTEAGKELAGSLRKQLLAGFTYIWERRPLFWLAMFAASLNFLLTGISTVMTPYILSRTNSEPLLGLANSLFNIGMVLGAIGASLVVKRGYRVQVAVGTIFVMALMLTVFGVVQTPPGLMILSFLMLLPLPAANTAFMSLMQDKVAPDVQGRVFAFLNQIAMMFAPLSNLIVGPLVDQVFEPAVGKAGWERVAPLVGSGPGSGIGLLIVFAGIGSALICVVYYAAPSIRQAEHKLPSYDVTPVTAPIEAAEPAAA